MTFDRVARVKEHFVLILEKKNNTKIPKVLQFFFFFSLKTVLMTGAALSCQFTQPRPFPSHFIISVCAQRHTCVLQVLSVRMTQGFKGARKAASYRKRRSTLEAWFSSVEVSGSFVILTTKGLWCKRLPITHPPMCHSWVVLSMRFWC